MTKVKVNTAVIAVAGSGTRFLPATKVQPKEMLPIVDKPIIQYVVEEMVNSGIKNIILVTKWDKKTLEDHFDRSFELEHSLAAAGATISPSLSNTRIASWAERIFDSARMCT